MKDVFYTRLMPDSSEENLPDYSADFPHIASRALLDMHSVPWHWHEPVELFYIESGELEYATPGGTWRFPAGSGGLLNSNVLHMTRADMAQSPNIQLLHIFNLSLISGPARGRIEQRYFAPLRESGIEMIPVYPDGAAQSELLKNLRASFDPRETDPGYELRICAALSEIWVDLAALIDARCAENKNQPVKNYDRLKRMMVYIQERYAEKITVAEIAAAGYASQRECFRLFREGMRCTPVQYCQSYRLQMACRMLQSSTESATAIGLACGFNSGSYFGKAFLRQFGCTPMQYRRRWPEGNVNRR